jgi:hypothetical protein
MVLDRTQFAHHFNALKEGLGNDSSPLWAAEEAHSTCQWFVCVKPLKAHRFKTEYWQWCNATLSGKLLCYSSDSEDQKEWWGFTDKQDIVLWTLKWT